MLRTALPLNPDFALSLNDEPVLSSKIDEKEAWSFIVGKDEKTLAKNADYPWGPGEPKKVEVKAPEGATGTKGNEGNEIDTLVLPHAGSVWGKATLHEKPLERGKSEDLGRSHGFFVRVRGRLINLDDEDFSLGPELRHGTLTRFRMEVNADDLDDQVASARETLKESPALTELKMISPIFLWPETTRMAAEDETRRFRQRHPRAKGMAKMLFDAQVALDILAARPDVDRRRIGCIGHSLGAKEALYLAAFDPRITAVVSSRSDIGTKMSNSECFNWYLGDIVNQPAFAREHHQLLALAAPRPFLPAAIQPTAPRAGPGWRRRCRSIASTANHRASDC